MKRRHVLLALLPACTLAAACATDADAPAARGGTVLDTVAEVVFTDLPAPRGRSEPVAVAAGLHLIAVGLQDGEILLFDGTGALVQRFGRPGEGPGEFGHISALAFHPTTDSLWVFDNENRRASVYGQEDSVPARSVPLPGRVYGAVWADDTTLVMQGVFDGGRVLAMTLAGKEMRPALTELEPADGDMSDPNLRPVTPATGGGLWAAHVRRATLRRFGSDLAQDRVVSYRADMLDAVPEDAEAWTDWVDTQAAVLGMSQDASGSVWFLFGLPPAAYPEVADVRQAILDRQVGPEDLARLLLVRFDTAAFEAGPADTVAVGGMQASLLPGGLVARVDSEANGEPILRILRLRTLARR